MMNLPFFIHVPKTAGSSVRTLIEVNYTSKEVLSLYGARSEIIENCALTDEDKQGLRLVQGHFPYGIHKNLKVETPKYYCFLREPVARTLSDIAHASRHPSHGFYHILSKPDLSIYERGKLAEKIIYYRNNMTHFLSGLFFSREVTEADFFKAREHLLSFEFVGITEHSELSMLIMGRKLGWRYIIPQTCNVSPDLLPTVNQEVSELCQSFLQYDLLLYKIALEEFNKVVKQYGTELLEAAEQLREVLSAQEVGFPSIKFNTYMLGDGLDVSILEYMNNIPPNSPLSKWIKSGNK